MISRSRRVWYKSLKYKEVRPENPPQRRRKKKKCMKLIHLVRLMLQKLMQMLKRQQLWEVQQKYPTLNHHKMEQFSSNLSSNILPEKHHMLNPTQMPNNKTIFCPKQKLVATTEKNTSNQLILTAQRLLQNNSRRYNINSRN